MNESKDASGGGVLIGFSIGMALHLTLIPVLMYLGYLSDGRNPEVPEYQNGYTPVFVLLLAGVVQLLYMVPAYLIAMVRGARAGFLKGMVLAASLLFLLNVGFCGIGTLWA